MLCGAIFAPLLSFLVSLVVHLVFSLNPFLAVVVAGVDGVVAVRAVDVHSVKVQLSLGLLNFLTADWTLDFDGRGAVGLFVHLGCSFVLLFLIGTV